MKSILITAMVALLCYCTACGNKTCNDKLCGKPSGTIASGPDTATLTCKLTSTEMAEREEKLKATVFSKYEKMNELPDALEFIYADDKQYAPVLLDFITTERECCPFVTFNLKFEPNSAKVSLLVGGSPRIKEMMKKVLGK